MIISNVFFFKFSFYFDIDFINNLESNDKI